MSSDLEKAVSLLDQGHTLVTVNGDETITSNERGVKPLLDLLDGGITLNGYCVADKVIGKGASHLYALLKPTEIYASVISKPAYEILVKERIPIQYGILVESIINRSKTDICPIERAVMGIDDNEIALCRIRKRLSELSACSKS